MKSRRGRPRKKKQFFEDAEANEQFNETRGKRIGPQSLLTKAVTKGQREFDDRIRREFGCGPCVPLDLVQEVLATEDQPASDRASRAWEEYGKARDRQQCLVEVAAREKAERAAKRRQSTRINNRELLARVQSRQITRNSAAHSIHGNWENRGDGKSRPSIRTLNDWLK